MGEEVLAVGAADSAMPRPVVPVGERAAQVELIAIGVRPEEGPQRDDLASLANGHGQPPRPAGKRPAVLAIPTSHEDLLEALRTSLHASTPSPPGGYREPPPSSSASSCGQSSDPDDAIDYDYDDSSVVVDTTEWEGWIDWDRVTRPTTLPLIEAMRIES